MFPIEFLLVQRWFGCWLESNVVDLCRLWLCDWKITSKIDSIICNLHKSTVWLIHVGWKVKKSLEVIQQRHCNVLEICSGVNCTKKNPRIFHFLVSKCDIEGKKNFLFWPRLLCAPFCVSQNCTKPAANSKTQKSSQVSKCCMHLHKLFSRFLRGSERETEQQESKTGSGIDSRVLDTKTS